MSPMVRSAMAALGFVVLATANVPARAFCIWGFGDCAPANPIVGEYTLVRNPATTLTIASGKITSRTGPVSFSADYTIKSVDGNSVVIEVGPPEPKETVQVQVEKDLIKVRNSDLFAGDWKKRTPGS
jgi:hypothetical protein